MTANGVLCVLMTSTLVLGSALAGKLAIDPERSSLTVHALRSGLLSAFGHDHLVRAPIVSGFAEGGSEPRVEISVDARRMTVLDPDLAPADRDEVQRTMLGPEVLDVARFPEIRFRSTTVKTLAPGRWRVEGVLELHGQSAPVSFEVTGANGRFRGSATLSQKAFGIKPISVAGGTIKVKDEVKLDFEILTAGDRN